MRLLIASHACSVPENQKLFALAAAQNNWEVALLLPRKWKSEYGRYNDAQLLEGFDAQLLTANVLMNGSVPLHAYATSMTSLINKFKPDVVYSHNEGYALSTFQLCWASARAGVKCFGFFSCQNLRKRYPFPFRQLESWVYRKSSFFFPITDSVEQVHRDKGYKGASTVLPLGYDSDMFRPAADALERHAQRSGSFLIAYVGRIVEEKGLATLAKALGEIRDANWRLVVVGAGPYEEQWREQLTAQGLADKVDWRGFLKQHQMPEFFKQVDLIVLPSETRGNWKEQFGRVIVEANACGTPVLGSDSGEIPNVIGVAGGGVVFKEGDHLACALAIKSLMNEPAEMARLAESGIRNSLAEYSLAALAEKFSASLNRALHSTGQP